MFLQQSIIIKLSIDDVADITAIEQQCFSMPWSAAQCKLAFSQKHFFAFGIKSAGAEQALWGYVSFYQVLDEVEILNIAILPPYRKYGLGKHLLTNTLQNALKMGMKKAVLEVRDSNAPARKLYEGVGFLCVGRRPKYYTDTAEDALIYELVYKN